MRDATLSDLDALLDLENACYPPNQAYSREEYRYSLATAQAINLIHEEDKTLVGFVGAFHHKAWRIGHIYTVNVHPKARGAGLGSQLMAEAERRLAALGMKRVVLEVNVDNVGAMKLYEKCGYARTARLVGYYTQYENNDAWRYEKSIVPLVRDR